MLRRLLLPLLATAVLAGCATDYRYRGGHGDYYYGQPRVEYRYLGQSGYYGGFGLGYGGYGYGATYYYDRFGRLVYGYPGGYYGSTYYGGNNRYRPQRRHGDRDDHDDRHDRDDRGDRGDHADRPPPWRDFGGLQRQGDNEGRNRNRDAREQPMRRSRPASGLDAPMRQQRSAPSAPTIRERSESPSRSGGFGNSAPRPRGRRNVPAEE